MDNLVYKNNGREKRAKNIREICRKRKINESYKLVWIDKVDKKVVVLINYLCYNFGMEKIFEEFDIEVTEEQAEKLEKYYRMIVECNEKFNITAITERREVYVKHFVDSLLFKDELKSGKLLDVGSGGGLPAIPLAVANEYLRVTMLEATGKKCEFLSEVIDKLELKNVKVINGRAEELGHSPEFREEYDFCTARAVARLNILCEYCMPFVRKDGIFAAFKGNAEEEIGEAEKAIRILGGKIMDVKEAELVGAKREFIMIKKIESTPDKYPRANGRIRNNPI